MGGSSCTPRPISLAPTLCWWKTSGSRLPVGRRKPGSRHALLRVTTRRATEFVDITDRLAAIVAASSVRARLINIQTLHTTTGIVVNEHEPLLLTDFESTLEKAAPADISYRHDDLSVLEPSI